MPAVRLDDFHDLYLQKESRLISGNYATAIVDANTTYGDLRPYCCPEEVCDVGTGVTKITPMEECECLAWDNDVDIEMDDTCGNYIVKDNGKLYITPDPCGDVMCDLCIADCPSVNISLVENKDYHSRYVSYRIAYIMTVGGRDYFGKWGEPTAAVSIADDTTVTITHEPPENECVTKYAIFRAEKGLSTGNEDVLADNVDWFLIDIAPINSTYTDIGSSQIKEKPVMMDEYGCVDGDIISMGKNEDGIYFALTATHLWYTIQGHPTAWHKSRRWAVSEAGTPLKLLIVNQYVYVLTDDKPIVFTFEVGKGGIRGERTIINKYLPLVAPLGAVASLAGIVYPSEHGFVMFQKYTPKVVTLTLDELDWVATKPETGVGTICADSYYFSTEVDAFRFHIGDVVYEQNANTLVTGLSFDGIIHNADYMFCYKNKLRWVKEGIVYELDPFKSPARNHVEGCPTGVCGDICDDTCCPYFFRLAINVHRIQSAFSVIQFDIDKRTDIGNNGVHYRYMSVECGANNVIYEGDIHDCKGHTMPMCRKTDQSYIEGSSCAIIKSITLATSFGELGAWRK